MTPPKYFDLQEIVRRDPPRCAIVLGSGLDSIADNWRCVHSLRFDEIPGMPPPTVAGHRGQLGLFEFAGESILVFQGRVHFYEGYPWELVERPVRMCSELGAGVLILTNASGGIGQRQQPGSLMAIRDQIASMRPHWWRLPGRGGIGPPAPSPYSPRVRELLRDSASELKLELADGVYAAVTGPSYETPAEIRALQILGADAVGMSTVHEAIVAHSLGMEVAGLSCVANRAAGLSSSPISHAEVLAAVKAAATQVAHLLEALVRRLAANGLT
jgi:purine-nucleoside phosphorylase